MSKLGVDDLIVAHGAATYLELVAQAEPVPDEVGPAFANYTEREVKDEGGNAKRIKVGKTLTEITDSLHAHVGGAWPKRVETLPFAEQGGEPLYLEKPDALLAWIGRQLDQPVRWASGADKVTQAIFFAHVQQSAERFDAVELYPHEPPLPRHYYMHPEPLGGDGKALDGFLDRLSPATDLDRSLMHSALLTLVWGGSPGSRPAYLVAADDDDGQGGRGAGKTTLAIKAGKVFGGHFDVAQSADWNRTMSDLLSPPALKLRLGLLDNVKSLRLSFADLEALITNDSINGHRLFLGHASRPNTLTWFLTLNGASLSKDLAQRCVIVHVKRPARYSEAWGRDFDAFIEAKRWDIVGDCIAQLAGAKPKLASYTRWGEWEGDVLACVRDPEGCQELIAQRQADVDADQQDSDMVRAAIADALRVRGHDPDKAVVFIAAAELANVLNASTGEKRPTNKASAYVRTLAIPELRKSKRDGRGWRWMGLRAVDGPAKPFDLAAARIAAKKGGA